MYVYIYTRYQGALGVSTDSTFSSARVHLYYCLSDKFSCECNSNSATAIS